MSVGRTSHRQASDEALERLVDEQAALRRVATLVAQGVPPEEIFAAVSDVVGRLVGTDSATVMKFDDDVPGIIFVGVASKMSDAFPLGARWKFQDGMASAEVYRTGRSARSTRDWSEVEGPVGETHHRLGIVSAVASPIVVEGRLWGAMAVQSQVELPLDTEERLERFTELLATAIANAENRATLTRLAEEQAALRRMATLVARGVRPDEIFAAVSDEVGRLVGTDSAAVVKYDDEGAGIVFVGVASRVSGAFPLGAHWLFQDGMASAEVYRTGRSARTGAHLSTVEGPIGDTQRRLGIISAVASPIVVEGRLWGAMAVHGQESLPLGTEERLEKFTELVATAIANAESRAGLTSLADEQAALHRVATLVASGVPQQELFGAVVEEVLGLVPVGTIAMGRYDPDEMLTNVAMVGEAGAGIPIGSQWPLGGKNVSTIVAQTRRPARIDSYADAPGVLSAAIREEPIGAAVGTPIIVEDRLWGVMTASSSPGVALPPDIEKRLVSFTELVATAIANAESRAGLARLAEEQAALRRVATLVARGAPPAELFTAVTEEAGQLLRVDGASMGRYGADGMFTTVAAWKSAAAAFPVGRTWILEGKNIMTLVLETGRPARMDTYAEASGPVGVTGREAGFRSSVGTPIVVEGRLWGAMTVASSAEEPLPGDTEARLASFTELVATAIANAEGHAELTASRARIVAAADEARRRIERDLHDGAQQRLVSLGLELRMFESTLAPDLDEARLTIGRFAGELHQVLDDLREISRGVHPAILSEGGLGPAMRALARRSAIPVELQAVVDQRLPEPIEVAAYFVASEALANAAKHAGASSIELSLATSNGSLLLSIRDDGVGGADPARGSGLVGLTDRVEALGGTIDIESAPGAGTSLVVTLPLDVAQQRLSAAQL